MADELLPRRPSAKDAKPKCAVEPVDAARAARLRAFAAGYPAWGRTKSPKVWEQAFAILRRGLGAHAHEIDGVLDWYVGWYAPGKKPTIANGQQFRDRWDWLHGMYTRSLAAAVRPEALTAAGRYVYEELASRPWPGDAAAQLPGAVATTLRNLEEFTPALARAALPRAHHIVRDVVEELTADHRVFAVNWFTAVWKRVHNWKAWDQNLARDVWTPKHAVFLRTVDAALAARTGTPDASLYPVVLACLEKL